MSAEEMKYIFTKFKKIQERFKAIAKTFGKIADWRRLLQLNINSILAITQDSDNLQSETKRKKRLKEMYVK